MTYPLKEQSDRGGHPTELYRYAGTYTNFYYTSGPVPVTWQAPDEDEPNEYLPLNTQRSPVMNATPDDDAAEITITMPVSTDLIVIYGFQIAPPKLVLTVFRLHDADEFVRYWQGNVENIQVARGTATIRVPSEFSAALSADFPNVYFQNPCNHNLFDPQCGVSFDDWSIETSVVAIDGKNIEVGEITVGTPPVDPPDPDFPDDPDYIDLDGQLLGGDAILSSGERRMIVAQVGNIITVNYPFAQINEDDTIVIAAGCDLAWKGDCKTRFNNTRRYGGQPLIPPKNIFAAGIEPGTSVEDVECVPVTFEGWDYRLRAVFTTTICGVGGLSFIEGFGPSGALGATDQAYVPDANPGAVGPGTSVEATWHINAHDDGGGTNYDNGPDFNGLGTGVGDWSVRLTSFLIAYAPSCGANQMKMELYVKCWNGEEQKVGDTGFVDNSGISPWFYFSTTDLWNVAGRGLDNSSGYHP